MVLIETVRDSTARLWCLVQGKRDASICVSNLLSSSELRGLLGEGVACNLASVDYCVVQKPNFRPPSYVFASRNRLQQSNCKEGQRDWTAQALGSSTDDFHARLNNLCK